MRAALAAASIMMAAGVSAGADKPNVVFFLIDHMGWRDLGCYGGEFIETPVADRLAAEGVRFFPGLCLAGVLADVFLISEWFEPRRCGCCSREIDNEEPTLRTAKPPLKVCTPARVHPSWAGISLLHRGRGIVADHFPYVVAGCILARKTKLARIRGLTMRMKMVRLLLGFLGLLAGTLPLAAQTLYAGEFCIGSPYSKLGIDSRHTYDFNATVLHILGLDMNV